MNEETLVQDALSRSPQERAAFLDRLDRGVAAEHDLDLLVDDGADHLVDRGVQPAEFGVEVPPMLVGEKVLGQQ